MSCSPMTGNRSNLTHRPNRIIVSLKERVEGKESLAFLQEDGFKHLETFDFPEDSFPGMTGDMVLLEAPDQLTTQAALAELNLDERVEFAEADLEFKLDDFSQPSAVKKPDDLNTNLWALSDTSRFDIDAPEAWTKTTGSRNGPIIAVLDTGVDLDHPDLATNLWTNTKEIPNNGKDDDRNGVVDDVHGFDAYNKNGSPDDRNGHGTHCAGTIGAVGNNDRGVVGVNWQARIMPIKIFNDKKDPRASTSAILRGISYAVKNGARITSNSWGGPGRSRSVERAFQKSTAFHLMAAGNDSHNTDEKPHYPSNYNVANSLSVASTTRWDGSLSDFSNFGETTVDLAAPGSSIYSTVPGGRYGYKSGTSMATPHVAGVAGLMLTLDPTLSNAQVREGLMNSVDKSDKLSGKVASGGRLNANKALEQVERLTAKEPSQ